MYISCDELGQSKNFLNAPRIVRFAHCKTSRYICTFVDLLSTDLSNHSCHTGLKQT